MQENEDVSIAAAVIYYALILEAASIAQPSLVALFSL